MTKNHENIFHLLQLGLRGKYTYQEKLCSERYRETYDMSRYDWDRIAGQVADVYNNLVMPVI